MVSIEEIDNLGSVCADHVEALSLFVRSLRVLVSALECFNIDDMNRLRTIMWQATSAL